MFDDADLARAGALRAAWRADEEDWSRAALERWEHGRTLVDALRESMHRGDTVAIVFASVTFTGTIASVGTDVARFAVPDGGVDVHIDEATPAILRVVTVATRGGGRGDTTVTTFIARLRQLEGTRVELGVRASGATVGGRLLVGRDQVSVVDRDGRRAYVPIGSVCWVRPVDVD
jgi:Mrp family chromosome partitioning ATPase